MKDRERAIKTLEDIIATAEGIKGLSEYAGITISLDKIDSLRFALESIKVDRAYDLAYEKVDFIEIPEGATFGDMMKAVFPNMEFKECIECWTGYDGNTEGILVKDIVIDKKLWNSPYRKEQK